MLVFACIGLLRLVRARYKFAGARELITTDSVGFSHCHATVYRRKDPHSSFAMSSADTAVSGADLSIPLIDFSEFLNPSSPEARSRCAVKVLHGFTTAGFIYLKDHGISASSVTKATENAAKFFHRPQEQKDALSWSSPSSNRGYMRLGREKTTDITDKDKAATLRGGLPDMKETIDIGREGVEGLPNQWPDSFDEEGKIFKRDMYEFWMQCKKLHVQVMKCVGMGLGYDVSYFDHYTDKGDNTLRLLHYPSVPKNAFDKAERAGAHCDVSNFAHLRQYPLTMRSLEPSPYSSKTAQVACKCEVHQESLYPQLRYQEPSWSMLEIFLRAGRTIWSSRLCIVSCNLPIPKTTQRCILSGIPLHISVIPTLTRSLRRCRELGRPQ